MTDIYIKTKDWKGNPAVMRIHKKLAENLDAAKKRNTKNWDYVAIIAGYPGVGKSTFARVVAKYCDPNFTTKNIAFSGQEFIEKTTDAPEYSSIVLDESFADLNSKMINNPEFIKIVNHLQLLRQKRLFIFLTLPNFFELAKGIAIFRSSHLFVIKEDPDIIGGRGHFEVFDREAKRMLFIQGQKYIDYNAYPPNFKGNYVSNDHLFDMEDYETRKMQHLTMQRDLISGRKIKGADFSEVIWRLHTKWKFTYKQLMELTGKSYSIINYIMNVKSKEHKISIVDNIGQQKEEDNKEILQEAEKIPNIAT